MPSGFYANMDGLHVIFLEMYSRTKNTRVTLGLKLTIAPETLGLEDESFSFGKASFCGSYVSFWEGSIYIIYLVCRVACFLS